MNDKYIIDGVEYSYGEEVEVRNDGYWCKRIFVGYIKNAIEPIICASDTFEKEFKNEYEIIGYWKGSKEKTLKVEIDIQNPFVVDNGDFGLVDKRQEILNANIVTGKQIGRAHV